MVDIETHSTLMDKAMMLGQEFEKVLVEEIFNVWGHSSPHFGDTRGHQNEYF